MIKLNDRQLYVGQIKQLLKDFNLPNCEIINTSEDETKVPVNKHFIKGTTLFLKTAAGKKRISSYNYGYKYLNLTSNLKIDNLIYDRNTHRYLGKYLRFLRDYKNVDLMSMYNLFDQESFDNSFSINWKTTPASNNEDVESMEIVNFNTDSDFITYKVPITRNALSIKTFANKNLYLCVYVDNKNTDSATKDLIAYIAKATYKNVKISDAIEYKIPDNLSSEAVKFIDANIDKLYLLVKVSKDFDSSITILEGNNYADTKNNLKTNKKKLIATNEKLDYDVSNFKIFPQLFSTENAKSNYLLADRLVEYLSGNVICPLSDLNDINRFHYIVEHDVKKEKFKIDWKKDRIYGKWTNSDSLNVQIFILNNINKIQNQYDLLGYIDKDVEILIRKELDNALF